MTDAALQEVLDEIMALADQYADYPLLGDQSVTSGSRRAALSTRLRSALSAGQPEEGRAGRLWIDTEFNEFRGELISIGIVDEQGREFYEVLPEPMGGYLPWVAQHVVPILNKPPVTLSELKAKLHLFLASYGNKVHLIADWPEDIEHFLHLLIVGPGERVGPDRWTMEVRRDLPSTAETSAIPHNALEDAKALRAGHLLMDAAVEFSTCEDKNPAGCWNVRCQLGKRCCRAESTAPARNEGSTNHAAPENWRELLGEPTSAPLGGTDVGGSDSVSPKSP